MARNFSSKSSLQQSAFLTGAACFVLCLLSLLFAPSAAFAASEKRIEFSTFDPCPTGKLVVARPTVAWKVIPHGNAHVTGVTLLINNKAVANAEYIADKQAVWYTPATCFAPGKYSVHCEVTLDKEYPVEKDWQFTVAANAAPAPAEPNSEQLQTFETINTVRRELGLPPVTMDSRLCAAAKGHSLYVAANSRVGHTESPSCANFSGGETSERVSSQGYAGGCFEIISQGAASPMAAVRRLFAAPYHRAAFLQPGTFDVGGGTQEKITTLLLGTSDEGGVGTYPRGNQNNAPLSWDGIEYPNPLRLHKGATPVGGGSVGYPITLFTFAGAGDDEPRLSKVTATLETAVDNKPVAVFVNSSDNDDFLTNGVLIIPAKPLHPSTTYRVRVQAIDAGSLPFSHTWTFTTAAK